MKYMFETTWVFRHGAPRSFCADHEFCRPVLQHFITLQKILLNPRPSRSSNRAGKIERNNGVFKMVIEKLRKEDTNGTLERIVARALLITNLIKESKVLNAFELARGYSHSIFGISRNIVPQDHLDAHVERKSLRELERMIRGKSTKGIDKTLLTKGKVLIYHKRYKQNVPNEWVEAKIEDVNDHIVTCRRRQKGPSMTVAHKDVRMIHRGPRTREIMMKQLSEDDTETNEISKDDTETNETIANPNVNEK